MYLFDICRPNSETFSLTCFESGRARQWCVAVPGSCFRCFLLRLKLFMTERTVPHILPWYTLWRGSNAALPKKQLKKNRQTENPQSPQLHKGLGIGFCHKIKIFVITKKKEMNENVGFNLGTWQPHSKPYVSFKIGVNEMEFRNIKQTWAHIF